MTCEMCHSINLIYIRHGAKRQQTLWRQNVKIQREKRNQLLTASVAAASTASNILLHLLNYRVVFLVVWTVEVFSLLLLLIFA
jgi:hypothetical protein